MATKEDEKIPRPLLTMAFVLVLGAIAPMLDGTMVNIALNDFAKAFGASLDNIQWIVTGYVLATGIAVPFSGWLIQRFDGKKVYIAAQIVFLIGSVTSGLSWNLASMIVFRLIQGFSAGLIMPLLTTLLIQAAGQKILGRLMSIVGLPMVLGPILGPVIGGVLVDYLSWHWIFFINVPVVFITLYFIHKKLPSFPPANQQAKLDWLGILLLGGISVSFIYGITAAAEMAGFNNTKTITFILIGAVLTVIYVMYALRNEKTVIMPLNLFKFRSFSASFCGLFLAGIGTMGPMLLLPLLFQNVRNDSIIVASLSLIPQGVGMLLVRPLIGKMIDRIGAKIVVIISIVISLVGTIPFIGFDQNTSYWMIAIVLLIRGIGVGGVAIPLMSDAYTGLAKTQIPQASIATRIVQNIGGAFGSAVLATIVVNQLKVATPDVSHLASAYQAGFLTASILMVIMIVPSLFLTNKVAFKVAAKQ
ncbi:DHA2 family efflux MFS transporter permease subunit [Paenibacillus sp. LMG 31461]|uniref:DHA2 family efflux MFS transporter permease subunit n=1 Tax=Paenibacillus plantarum TaxID=2654975 RepID=A0ABX1XAU7_9BACL|nr:MDR family MFS transporter [Paenibacillus plantarum]NOU65516.1 DHA2 family efflux MFS transporter permease subunit [Paenibacillus plantarum]